ncbi:AraC family transcriptional regulator [Pseudomaricurvus sp. HS19]|uniref:helix-turn-helix domain-containing protein n=1 Tax=Pseudomaricurvus sp. HS19 TaxID=2692626 RepID=UPI00136AE0B8|nr:helix-turn-helix transcriptional regulator [Pseudomaricurvus sp. HS19]MYM61874.1 helix-turn-helix domain-containing protein [Pseudomaricurvus sp. HS19]
MTRSIDFSPMRPDGSEARAGAYNSGNHDIETPWHYHDLHQLIYAFEGSVEVEGVHGRYKVPNQFAVWIPAGLPHRTSIHGVRSGSVFLSPDMLALPGDSLRVIAANNLMREMIMYAMRWPISGEREPVSEAFFNCFAHLCSEWLEEEVQLVLPATDNRRINAVVGYTRQHLPTVTLDEVCDAVGMSPRTLRRNFRKAMGISWEDYRLRMRMYLAIDTLEKTSKPVWEVAEYVGYGSQQAFYRAFKAFVGMGPTAYRNIQGKPSEP